MHHRSLCTGHRPCNLLSNQARRQNRLCNKPRRYSPLSAPGEGARSIRTYTYPTSRPFKQLMCPAKCNADYTVEGIQFRMLYELLRRITTLS